MAVNRPDRVGRGAGKTDQRVPDGQLRHLIDEETAGKQKIHHGPHLADIAVFERKHGAVAFAVLHGAVSLLKTGKAHIPGFGEKPAAKLLKQRDQEHPGLSE